MRRSNLIIYKMIEGKNFGIGEGISGLTTEEKDNIKTRADLRRRRIEFIENAKTASSLSAESDIALVEYRNKVFNKINKEAAGEIPLEKIDIDTAKSEVASLINQADEIANSCPNVAAFYFAKAAKLEMQAGLDFQENLKKARKYIDRSKGIPKIEQNALLPEAIVMGIEGQVVKSLPEIPLERVAENISQNPELAVDYALVLPEEKRESFLFMVPEKDQTKISILLDKGLGRFVKEAVATAEQDVTQRQNIQKRIRKALEVAISNPDEEYSRPLVKALTETLLDIGGEDSKKILTEVAVMSLAGHKDAEKNVERMSYASRILKTLSTIDRNKGGIATMKFLGKKEIPERLFIYFSKELIKTGFISSNVSNYLEEKDIPFLRKLIAEYPNQFNTVIDSISKIKGYEPSEHQDEIFSAIKDLDSITPIIFDRYRKADAKGKKELALQIKELKPKFFQNIPIKNILPAKDREILTEMVYLAYKPIGMSLKDVERLIGQVDDQTEDLKSCKFPQEGYDFSLTSQKRWALKEKEKIDCDRIGSYRNIFGHSPENNQEEKEKSIKEFSSLLGRLSKAGTDFKPDELQKLMSLISEDELVTKFKERYKTVNEANAYNYLNELKEIIGIYFKDNYEDRLISFMGANKTTEENLIKILANPDRIKTLKMKMGDDGNDIDWDRLNNKKSIAHLLTRFLSSKVLKSLQEEVNRNVNKFQESREGAVSTSTTSDLRVYISKNIGSFFAKASAGICTAQDVSLFQRNDHFHINIVEKEQSVRANIQAYVIKDGKEKSLVLRGFNPNTDFIEKIDIGGFCEKILEIAKQFQKDNGLAKVYIVEQTGWHPLSNREQVASYLVKKYAKEKNRKSFTLQVSSSASVSNIYEV